MSPEHVLRLVAQGNRKAGATPKQHALAIVEFGHTRLGDIVQAFTNLRYLKEHLQIRHLDVNLIDRSEYRLAAEILRNDPLVRSSSNLPYGELRYWDYQVVLHYTVFRECEIVRVLGETHDRFKAASQGGVQYYSIPASVWDLQSVHGDAWHRFIHPLPLLDVPPNLLEHAAGNHRLYLSREELTWAEQWLAQAGVAPDEKLIVFIDDASVREKVLHPLSYLRVLEHFLSMEKMKALVYDVREQGKQEVYRELLGAKLFSRIVFASGGGLRKDLALLAAGNVRAIFGPDTGMMHCAAGVHATLRAEHPAREHVPLILVYAGRWQDFNLWNFWSDADVCCMVFYETDSGKVLRPLSECPRSDAEFSKGLAHVAGLPAELIVDFLRTRLARQLGAAGLLQTK